MCLSSWFKVARDSDYLLITGAWIDELKIKKKAMLLPGQAYAVIELASVSNPFNVRATSSDNLPFVLHTVFRIGPHATDMECVKKYFEQLLVYRDKNPKYVEELVQGVIEGQTRVLGTAMTMQEVLRRTKEFEQEVIKNVQLELKRFRLFIYNANVKQFVDVPRHQYFS